MTMEMTLAPWMMAPGYHAATQVLLADTCAGYAAHLPGAKGFTTLG